jgi:hypothetical protein
VPEWGRRSACSAHYWASVAEFLSIHPDSILGQLAAAHTLAPLEVDQTRAWAEQIEILGASLIGFQGTVFLEFEVPRLGSRIDAVLVSGPAVFPIEFKCGEQEFSQEAYNQAWDYALDLKNFHLASHAASILPVLVATAASTTDERWQSPHADGVTPPRRTRPVDLPRVLKEGLALANGPDVDGDAWGTAPYHPTPTIIEAARALYSRHSVEAITRNDAGAKNLSVTSTAVEEIIERAHADGEKAIIFVTGVPGAGKTLVGLNVATRRRDFGEARAVFLSGNGPLVAVLQEALARDEMSRQGIGARKGSVRQQVKPFIQNVHHFRDEGIRNPAAPYDHVVIFDEAQRAWDKKKTADFMKRRKKIPDFRESESEFLISYLDRHREWAVIICLVGVVRKYTQARPASRRGLKRCAAPSRIGTPMYRPISRNQSTQRALLWTTWKLARRSQRTAAFISPRRCALSGPKKFPRSSRLSLTAMRQELGKSLRTCLLNTLLLSPATWSTRSGGSEIKQGVLSSSDLWRRHRPSG